MKKTPNISFEDAAREIKARRTESLLDQAEFDLKSQEIHRKKLENTQLSQELEFKETICTWVIKTVSNYLITVFALIFTATVFFPIFKLETGLSDQVLITLLTTTTVSLIGLPTLIIKSLFPSKNKDDKTRIN